MGKRQTRRSVSIKGITYERCKRRCEAKGEAVSNYVERIIARDLDMNGADARPSISIEDAVEILRVCGSEHDVIHYAGIETTPFELESKILCETHRIAAADIRVEFADVYGQRVTGTLAGLVQDRLLERVNEHRVSATRRRIVSPGE
jgi:hypothetical protein